MGSGEEERFTILKKYKQFLHNSVVQCLECEGPRQPWLKAPLSLEAYWVTLGHSLPLSLAFLTGLLEGGLNEELELLEEKAGLKMQ